MFVEKNNIECRRLSKNKRSFDYDNLIKIFISFQKVFDKDGSSSIFSYVPRQTFLKLSIDGLVDIFEDKP